MASSAALLLSRLLAVLVEERFREGDLGDAVGGDAVVVGADGADAVVCGLAAADAVDAAGAAGSDAARALPAAASTTAAVDVRRALR
ncbi:hypothetical protein [Microbacterium sp. No. 7]|uniref:hypothetical protein n=1 Tax=Microbacterium sp. No. 7 TaxID=1714373 RepID=UPI0012E1F6EE|nr:hypothetical protein [Microbacterium sp. No. 7]